MNRRIDIKLFDFPTKEEMLPLFKKSPLYEYNLKQEVFEREDLDIYEQVLNYSPIMRDRVNLLNSKIFQINLSYAYVSYYFQRGIPDDFDSLKHITNEQATSRVHFQHHTDSFFQRAFTTLDLLARLLFDYFGLEANPERNGTDITFKGVLYMLPQREKKLFRKLVSVKKSKEFKIASDVRNDIIHNNPPYRMHIREEVINGVKFTKSVYFSSEKLMKIMNDFLWSIKKIFEIVKNYISNKKRNSMQLANAIKN
ncbi:Cthe_2314 family HEPN domain-containing protein [Priestia megaterium]|uniref:Cthe_2314 family HEPN domain-containing protein n=1 Tax=Priestia megaterium TaxID=1404 RepID=UPI002079FBFF|nr:Cthe_2314 family HEPN domain-containing protein [Priestia megaterium]USL32922.1 hypothetical protein LIT30_12235 [Priestia megaterium]